jgi:hypothetical protein
MEESAITDKDKYTLIFSITRWGKSIEDPNLLKYLRIALKLYVLEGLGFQTKNMKPNEFAKFCDKLTLQKFMKQLEKLAENNSSKDEKPENSFLSPKENLKACVLEVFDQQFEAALALELVKESTKHNYRSVIGRFCEFLVQQTWWQELFPPQMPEFIPKHPGRAKKNSTYKKLANYGLSIDKWPAHVVKQSEEFKNFVLTEGEKEALLQGGWKRNEKSEDEKKSQSKLSAIAPSSLKQYENTITYVFGWYVHIQGGSVDQLDLELLTDANLLARYTYWCIKERGRSYHRGMEAASVGIAIAKWKNINKSKRQNWSDIEVILELRDFRNYCDEKYDKEKKKKEEEKWKDKELTHSQARQVVQYLRSCCATHRGRVSQSTGKRIKANARQLFTVVWSLQVYLIVKILVYLPVRQQEVRQYEIGKTLFRKLDAKGRPYYQVIITEHKNKSKTGKDRKYKLPSILTADLDAWINVWRPKAVEAVQTLPDWLKFKGYKPEELEILQQRLDAAKRGEFKREVKNPQKYIENLESRIRSIRYNIAAWETARTNLTNNGSLFFSVGNVGDLNKFGQPLSRGSVRSLVVNAISEATSALFKEPRWTNPHALRHIAAKHVRLLKKDTKGMAAAMGHSEEQADKYADQIMTESDLIDNFIDSWWESDDLDLND